MTRRKLAYWIAAACAIVAPGVVYGQAEDAFSDANCYHEQQWFAPVDFDYNDRPIERDCGYTFSYSRLSWAITGERTPLGTGGTDEASLNPFRQFLTGRAGSAVSLPTPVGKTPLIIAPPELLGGIDSGPPRADFGWGDRYEVGYYSGDHGWKVGIIDGV